MNVEIRRLHPGDDDLVMQVADEVFDEPVRPDRLAAYLASPGHFMIVAAVDQIVVGQCAAVIHRHPDKVSELYIDGKSEDFVMYVYELSKLAEEPSPSS